MNALQQFSSMLDGLEDGELKTSLVNAYGNVKIDFNQAIEKRNTIKDEYNTFKEGIKKTIGSDDLEEIGSKIQDLSKSGSEDIEKLKSDLQAKYEKDTNELRGLYEAEQNNSNDLRAKYENMLFDNAVEKQGLLTGFNTDNPRVKDMILSEIREKLIFENNTFYVKDEATGDKARDIKSGEYLSAKSISDNLKSSPEWMPFVKPDAQAQGGGTPPPNQANSGGKKWNDYSSSELVAISRENPSLYEQLKTTR